MEKEQQKKTELIGLIYEKSKHCGLDDAFLASIDDGLEVLSSYFQTTKIQAFFIANLIPMNFHDRTVGVRELITYFNCNPMTLMKYNPELEGLCKLSILKKVRSKGRRSSSFTSEYVVNDNVVEAISLGKDIELGKNTFSDIYQILQYIFELWQKVEDDELSSKDARDELEELIIIHQSLPLLQNIVSFDLCIQDTFFFLILIWKTLIGSQAVSIERTTEGFFDHNSSRIKYIRTFLSGENHLITKNIAELVDSNFANDLELQLTEKALMIMEDCGLKIYNSPKNKKRSDVVDPDDIIVKELIYNDEELKQLSLLKDLLDESNLNTTQCRLIERGLPQGITVLLHGGPGTGKTESVYQIAKHTGRQIMKVDISNSKSAFFGESEKKIKKIFTNYQTFCKECSKTPILLLNEADAILGKRKDTNSSNLAQTENAIQNIILEEMENFDGILVATTNLTNNLDSAFDRRFLFKVEFKKPKNEVKAQIWKLKLPRLFTSEYESLASQFDFSGGQIDNIVRKAEISEIVNGQSVDFDQIICFCNEEILGNSNRNKIGFI